MKLKGEKHTDTLRLFSHTTSRTNETSWVWRYWNAVGVLRSGATDTREQAIDAAVRRGYEHGRSTLLEGPP